MTDNVISINDKIFKKKIIQFVDIYLAESAHTAALWALKNIDKVDYEKARVIIADEFKERGYEVHRKGEEE